MHDFNNDHLFFKMANRVYFKADSKLQDDFRLIAKESYDADLLETDFKRDANQLVNKINKWIELETKNRIQNVFKELDTETVMLLINVVYFKAKWMKPFPMSNVRLKKFTNLDGQKKRVETMYDVDYYLFGQFEQYGILQLDYIGNCSMYIVLPNEEVNLHDLLLELNARKLNEDLRELKSTHLDLQLPKFKLESDLNLKSVLEQLGVRTLFNEQANLSKMSNETGLQVSEAVQKAFVSVDEDGTEAAAVSITKLSARSMFLGSEFHVNRPFIFMIRLNGVNVFVGAIKQF